MYLGMFPLTWAMAVLSGVAVDKRSIFDFLLSQMNEHISKGEFQVDDLTNTSWTSGFVQVSLFSDEKQLSNSTYGKSPVFTLGFKTNECINLSDTVFAKFQLQRDSCSGGIVQYYKDIECSQYDRTHSLSAVSACEPVVQNNIFAKEFSSNIQCIAGQQPPSLDASVTYTSFHNADCQKEARSYITTALDTCIRLSENMYGKYSCNAAHRPVLSSFTTKTCRKSTVFESDEVAESICLNAPVHEKDREMETSMDDNVLYNEDYRVMSASVTC